MTTTQDITTYTSVLYHWIFLLRQMSSVLQLDRGLFGDWDDAPPFFLHNVFKSSSKMWVCLRHFGHTSDLKLHVKLPQKTMQVKVSKQQITKQPMNSSDKQRVKCFSYSHIIWITVLIIWITWSTCFVSHAIMSLYCKDNIVGRTNRKWGIIILSMYGIWYYDMYLGRGKTKKLSSIDNENLHSVILNEMYNITVWGLLL